MHLRLPYLDEDMHVPVPREDPERLIANVVPWALRRGVNRLGFVAAAGAGDTWIADFITAVRTAGAPPELDLLAGVEVEILDREGRLDLPIGLEGADFLLVSDDVLPTSVGRLDAFGLKEKLQGGEISALQLLREIVEIYTTVMKRYPGLVLARPFSMLRRLGIQEHWISEDTLRGLARIAQTTGCAIEVSERWRCPDPVTMRIFVEEDVPLLFATETRLASGVGRYDWALLATASLPQRASDCTPEASSIGSSSGYRAAS
jgi:putative hydrolase